MTEAYYTLTLNPTLDRTMYFERFEAGQLNRATEASQVTLGSKGINVSRFLKVFGVEAPAYGFSGGETGRQMERMLDGEGIKYRFVRTKAETRLNIKMISSDGTGTEANERGGPITETERESLISALISQIDDDASQGIRPYLFMGGSIPQGVEKSVYNSLVETVRTHGGVPILDCDGEALKNGVQACPSLIKPNLAELEGLVGQHLDNLEIAVEKSVEIFRRHSVAILCTMGGDGAFYVGEEGNFFVDAPKVKVRGFTGAGDTFLAAFILAKSQGKTVCEALAFGAGAASTKVQLPGSLMPRAEDVLACAAQRTVKTL